MNATDIIAYTYKADIYCRDCITKQLPTGEGEEFDGWGLAELPAGHVYMFGDGARTSVEQNLTEIAVAFGINREDEYSFDSGEFPKVAFAWQLEDGDQCGDCGAYLI